MTEGRDQDDFLTSYAGGEPAQQGYNGMRSLNAFLGGSIPMSVAETIDVLEPEPAWDVAKLFPPQGLWTEEEYLELTQSTNKLVEFTDGFIEVLPMPTETHQLILLYLLDALRAFVSPRRLGTVLMAVLRVRLRSGKFREPDIVFMRAENASRRRDEFWQGADLVMEIVSPDPHSQRDYDKKREDYAEAGIPEYWIVDPAEERITVLKLSGDNYAVHGQFTPGDTATSALLEGFGVDVDAVFAAGNQP